MAQWSEWIISESFSGERLVNVLAELLENRHSKRQIKRAIERGQCLRNGKLDLMASQIVAAGDHVRLNCDFVRSGVPIPTFEEGQVLFEDDFFLAYNKPPYLSSDRDGICELFQVDRPGLELGHRLDTDTSGVLLFAKSRGKVALLHAIFRRREIEKSYLCLVEGRVEKDSGRIENSLGLLGDKKGRVSRGELAIEHGGKTAITDWKVLQRGRGVSLVQCFPLTGRTHQIRLHMTGLGHPILGDYFYADRFKSGCHPPRHMLHARGLAFKHPKTEEDLKLLAPIPQDFIEAAESRGIVIPEAAR